MEKFIEDKIGFIDNSEIENKIQLIIRQTNYDTEIALNKLKQFNYDHISVIKDFMGIPIHKQEKIKSVNQEIYRQIRYKLNDSLNTYNKNNPVDINKVIENLHISEENEKNKKK
jgi:hypothetical protein